jgi:hypothetical protein
MAKATERNTESWQNQYMLAKLLFHKYGVLHSFHEWQLKNWPIVCCEIAIDGSAIVEPSAKKVTYKVYTKKNFKLKAKATLEMDGSMSHELVAEPRSKYSPMRLIIAPGSRYNQQRDQAFLNLQSWTRDMLWPDTEVELIYDDQR